MKKALICLVFGALASHASLIEYDLASDFSTTLNPNGVWSYAGTIIFDGEVWYAHSPVERSNDYLITLDGGPTLASGTVTNGDGLDNASPFSSSGPLAVTAGEVLALELTPSAQQEFGSLAGVNFDVELTPDAPEPGTTLLLAGGLLAVAVAAKRSV